MNAVLFFCLNSLGLILVQTQKPPPYFTPFTTDCRLTKEGREYAGPVSVTRSGRTCQRWDTDTPNYSSHKTSTRFPDGSASAAGNKCRNPQDSYYEGVWCYTTDPNKPWEDCDVKFCDVGCKQTQAGHEYAGPLNVTLSGRICQRWDTDKPHINKYKDSKLYPEGSPSASGNKCRNPAGNYNGGVWCYTTDPNVEWELCDVPFCNLGVGCKLSKAGREYTGPLSVTKSGRTCQRWDSDQPHTNTHKNSPLFPEGSASAAGNKCRNPQDNYYEGVWCYTTDPNTRWEPCDVPFCDVGCKLTKAGHEYTGPLSVTRSGRTCQRWDSDQPHINKHKNSPLFPEGSASAAGNKCRNPQGDYYEGVWCYTTDPNQEWEPCDVPFCRNP